MKGPQLERYEILAELGQGGMSVVYRARDRQLPREVAVKVLHDFLARQPEARQRFHREAVAVAKLHHPGIVEIFDYSGPDREEAFIVTELIEGVTLRAFVEQRGGLPHPELGALIGWDLCRSLKHAHDRGVIHRDLKPENVMVTRDGQLKLMDFGIAQIQDGPRVTMTGTLLGSPAHMAPEVIDGERPDARADLFSLGTLLYWLATGKLPFDAPNPSALFRKILEGRYDEPQQLEPKIGNGLSRIIKRALETDRTARYATADELLADLAKELETVALVPPEVVVQRYFQDPDGFAQALRPALIERLTRSGREALAEKNVGRAMDRFNRILAIDPTNGEVRGLVASASRNETVRRRARQSAAAALVLGLAGTGGYVAGEVLKVDLRASGPEARADRPAVLPSALLGAPPEAEVVAVAAPLPPAPDAPEAPGAPGAPEPRADRPVARPEPRRPEPQPRKQDSAPEPVEQAAPDAGAVAAAPDASIPRVKLPVRIGGGWAKVLVDGRLALEEGYGGVISLSPGTHQLDIESAAGSLPPRIVEVLPDGTIHEVVGGERHEIHGELVIKALGPR